MDKFVTLGLVERLKNSDFILEPEMAELNQNKIQINQIRYENFILKQLNNTFNTTVYTCSTESLF